MDRAFARHRLVYTSQYNRVLALIRPNLPVPSGPATLQLSPSRAARFQVSSMRMRTTMKDKKRGRYNTNRLYLASAVIAAIKRCEMVCNPAIVRRPRFTIHVRRLSEGPTRSWLVSCVNSEALADGKENGNSYDQPSGQRVLATSLQRFTNETELRNGLPQ
jgi:hypothetical protein